MVQAVHRAVHVLRLLGTSGRLGVTELADRLGVAKPTVHGLLRTLEGEGLVIQDGETGKYALGPGLLQLGNAYLEGHELRIRSLMWADSLATQANEAVWVGVLTGGQLLVVHHAFRPEGAVQILEVGASVPWNTSALGKAIAAFLGDADLHYLMSGPLTVMTGASIAEKQVILAELEQVRSRGYAVEDQEAALGDAGIAAPVFDRSGDVVGAIGIVGPVERLLTETKRQEHAVAVREIARGLSRDLGARRTAGRRGA